MTAARDDDEPAPSADMIARLHATLDDVPALAGPREVEPLIGGLTNVNFKVTHPATHRGRPALRSDGDLLAIDRDAEHVNSRRAAESGAAPEVLDYLPERHALIVAWVEGRTLAADDLRDDRDARAGRRRSAARCTPGRGSSGDFDMFAVQRRYLGIVQERGFRLPDALPRAAAAGRPDRRRARRARRARRCRATTTCSPPTSSTTATGSGSSTTSTAATATARFELGNIWQESHLSLDQLDGAGGRLLRTARCATRWPGPGCSALMSSYGWTLWASIQASVSPIDFDFWSWGMEKYVRAVEELDGPDLEHLLAEASAPRLSYSFEQRSHLGVDVVLRAR